MTRYRRRRPPDPSRTAAAAAVAAGVAVGVGAVTYYLTRIFLAREPLKGPGASAVEAGEREGASREP